MISPNFGVVSDSRVSSALARILPMRGTTWTAIIRGIDSTRSLDDLTKMLDSHHVPHEAINGNVCVSVDTLQKCLDIRLFTGFDEVWIFSGDPPPFHLASIPSATSDAVNFLSSVPEELSVAIKETNCIVVLGDGCGLNYAVSDERIQEVITKAGP